MNVKTTERGTITMLSASTMLYTNLDSPIGTLLLVGDGRALHGLYMQEGRTAIAVHEEWEAADEPFADVRAQLADYFAGRRTVFELPLVMTGSPFQRRVWRALQDIPYGETISYGELANRIGVPSASRAVGVANGHNPISVIVPCHRVIGADGSLTGYGGGLERKRVLLDLEAGVLPLGEGPLPYGSRDSVPGGSTKRRGVLDSVSPL